MRILVAEDDPSIGEALCVAFRGQGFAVDLAESGRDADAALQDQSFDLVILDLGLPALDGFQVLQRLRGRSRSVPVIILSANSTLDSRVKGLDLGADDFVCKPFNLAELRARVQALLRRAADSLDPPDPGPAHFDTRTRRLVCQGQAIALSARETAMIEVLWKQFGRPVRKELLLDHSYDFAADASINAVEVCIHRLRRKLDATPITVRTVPGVGYVLEHRLH
jgi:DNA-binding response OmpR family regulator